MTNTPCIILAGGLGTRIKSVLGDVPKCLADVNSTAFLSLLVAHLRHQGFGNVAMSLGHGADQVERYLAEHAELRGLSICKEPSPLGTGGAILFAMEQLALDEAVIVNGDTFLDAPAEHLWNGLDVAAGEHIRMLAARVPDTARFGALRFGTDGRLTGFQEKGLHGAGYINAGYYRVTWQAFAARQPGEVFSFETEILTPACEQGAVRVAAVEGSFTDIGVPEDYWAFCRRQAA